MDLTKDDIRKIVVDLPMDKNYKISVQDFCRTPILSDEVFKFMDRNNDGQISKGELKLARKSLTLKQIDHLIKKLDKVRPQSMKNIMWGWVRGYYRTFFFYFDAFPFKDGNGTISLEELKNGAAQ